MPRQPYVVRNAPLNLYNFKGYEFNLPLVSSDKGSIDIVGMFDELRGIEFGFRVIFHRKHNGTVLCKRLTEAIHMLNTGKALLK